MESKELVEIVVEHIQAKKGYDIKVLDLRELSAMSDYFVICSADANVQVKAIADEVDEKMARNVTIEKAITL